MASITSRRPRLGPANLEALDTLIMAGIAGNRADAIRLVLARFREQPEYEQLRERVRETGLERSASFGRLQTGNSRS